MTMDKSLHCSKDVGLNRGAWTAQEDFVLRSYISVHGEGQWSSIPFKAGLKRCGKSCRLRWLNYLRPNIKRGNISPDEKDLIIRLHGLLGNRWSLIAGRLPGRTDNEIKNYWNTHLIKSKPLPQKGASHKFHTKSKLCCHENHCAPAVRERNEPRKSLNNGNCADQEQTTKNSNSWGELMVDDFITDMYSNFDDQSMSHKNRTKEEINENVGDISEEFLHMKTLASPRCDLIFSPSDSPRDFKMEDIVGMQSVQFMDKAGMQSSNMLLSEWEEYWEREAAILI